MMKWDNSFVKREYRRSLFPIMSSVLGATINTLIDSAFVSQSEGKNAMAAVNLCMPIYLVLCVVGVLFASGASTYASHLIGRNKQEEATRVYFSALTWQLILGAILTAAGIFLMRPLSGIIAQGTDLTQGVYDYGLVTAIGSIPTILIYLPIRFLQLDGKPKSISRLVIVMLIVDVVLDYVFLFPLKLGVGGAAIATVVSTVVACVYGFAVLQKGYGYRFSIRKMGICHTREILRLGSPSALGNLVDVVKMLVLNGAILSALGMTGAAIWGALNSLSEISLTISTGVPQTASPMIGVYHSSRENHAIRSLMRIQLFWGFACMAGYGLVLLLGNRAVAGLFRIQENMLIPIGCLVLFMLLDLPVGIWVRYLNTIGHVLASNVVNIFRRMLFPAVFVLAFLSAGKWLWLFLPVASVFTILGTIEVLNIEVRRIKRAKGIRLSPFLLLDDSLDREKMVLDFSIKPNAEDVCDAAEKIREFCELHRMDSKLLMRLSLSIEEMLMVLIHKFPDAVSVDLRAFVTQDETGIQIRIAGDYYDPFEDAKSEENIDNEELMGVVMMERMATMTTHHYALGMNILHIFFGR